LKALETLGGAARISMDDRKLIIRSEACPLAAAVSEHPEVCQVAESLLAEAVGADVKERCERNGLQPRCRFEIIKAA
jgi:predicted ArsR family transcriptional regulator